MRTNVVTGGAGFIGSRLCELLLSHDERVVCVDDFSTGKFANIHHLVPHPLFTVVRQDVSQPFDQFADVIFHLASPASPVQYQQNPVRTTRTNVIGSLNVLNMAVTHSARVLLASTSEVYGSPNEHPQSEEYWGNVNPVGPRSCYDEGKRCAETLFFDYHRQFDLDIRIARIFNTYGPRMDVDDGRVVSNFIVQALNNKDITIYGDGTQTRSFCFVDDLVNGLVSLMNQTSTVGPVNLGNPHEIQIGQLAELVISMCNSKSQVVYQELPQDDPTRRCPDVSKAKQFLQWAPEIPLNDGLLHTIEYFKTLFTA